jgi:hypothetical protein
MYCDIVYLSPFPFENISYSLYSPTVTLPRNGRQTEDNEDDNRHRRRKSQQKTITEPGGAESFQSEVRREIEAIGSSI